MSGVFVWTLLTLNKIAMNKNQFLNYNFCLMSTGHRRRAQIPLTYKQIIISSYFLIWKWQLPLYCFQRTTKGPILPKVCFLDNSFLPWPEEVEEESTRGSYSSPDPWVSREILSNAIAEILWHTLTSCSFAASLEYWKICYFATSMKTQEPYWNEDLLMSRIQSMPQNFSYQVLFPIARHFDSEELFPF